MQCNTVQCDAIPSSAVPGVDGAVADLPLLVQEKGRPGVEHSLYHCTVLNCTVLDYNDQ